MGHVGPPEPPNVRLRPKLTSCMETLWALTCFSTIPSYKTVTVKLILLRIFSATFFKCSSTFDTTSIILWMLKWTRIHTLGTSSPTHSPSTLFTFSNSTVLVKICGLLPWGYAYKYSHIFLIFSSDTPGPVAWRTLFPECAQVPECRIVRPHIGARDFTQLRSNGSRFWRQRHQKSE